MIKNRKYKKRSNSIRGKQLNKTRKTRKTRKMRKVQKGGNKEFIVEKIKEVFPEDEFSIVFKPSVTSFDIYNRGEADYKNLCVSFSLEYPFTSIENISPEDYKRIPKSISIDHLLKCNSSGSNTLEKIQLLAHKLGATQINLEDGSSIRACSTSLPLALLDILATGESWYNAKGYYSENYETERERNSQILSRNATEFIKECIEVEREKLILNNPSALSGLNNILELFNSGVYFDITDSMTVQEYFANMKQQLRRVNDEKCEMFIFASKLLAIIRMCKIIQYSYKKITKVI
jgi:hypothetical protein